MNPQQMYTACTDALGAFVRSAGFTDVVIGLSGGMDSTLVAVMAHDALGADHVHGVMLPGPYSSESSIDDAEALAANLGISNITVPICEPFEAFEAVLARACGGALTGLAAENTQARCRMVCLMALSNAHGWLMRARSGGREVPRRRLRHAGSDSHRLCGRGEGSGGHRRRERSEPRSGGLRHRPYRRQRLQARVGASVP